jgi:mono/diheme cytochrome c family protein
MRFSKILIAGIVLFASIPVLAQAPSYSNVGRAATKEEIKAWDISAGPDGKGLPSGRGTAKEGAAIFAAKCATCHGPAAEGGKIGPTLLGGKADIETLTTLRPVRSIGGYWAFATTLWDYINRSMPRNQGGSLSADEVYSLTAFILSKNGIIQDTDVLDATTLPKLKMPNRNGFIPQRLEDIPDERKRGCRQGVCP